MSNVSDLTLEVLKDIRTELRELRERVETDVVPELRALRDRVETGFAGVNQRLDSVLAIAGTHHVKLESRVTRIEDHLGLRREQ